MITDPNFQDNADLIFLRDGLDNLLPKLAGIIHSLSQFALEWKDEPTLGYTVSSQILPNPMKHGLTTKIALSASSMHHRRPKSYPMDPRSAHGP